MKNRSANPAYERRTVAIALLLCLATLCTMGQAAAERKVKQPKESRRSNSLEIESLEGQWRDALVKGDAVLMDKLLSDDFLAISARGTLSDKQQYVHRIATHATQLSSFDLMDLKVRVQTGSAVAVSQAHIVGVLEGRPIEGTFRYTKVYERAGGVWHMTNFEATRVSAAPDTGVTEGMSVGERTPHRRAY